MRVFVTGASGFIGAAVIEELLSAGHEVLGLARSDEAAAAVKKMGAAVHRGSLEDLESLRSGARDSDGVIHCAFNHDFSKFAANCDDDKRAIEAMGQVLEGSDRPFVVSSGVGVSPGRVRTEEDAFVPGGGGMPRVSEETALSFKDKGVCVTTMRLPQVHDPRKQGLITYLTMIAREKGIAAYVGDGANRLAAVPLADCAKLYKLVLEKGEAGACYHAIAEEGVSAKEIAEALGRGLKVPAVSIAPEEAAAHFGWMAMFANLDMPASSAITQKQMGWKPTGCGLIEDIDAGLAKALKPAG